MRHPLSVRALLLLTISVLTVLIALLVVNEVYQQWQRLEKIHTLKTATLISDPLFDVMERLSVERDMAYSLLFTDDRAFAQTLRPRLENSRREADATLTSTLETLSAYDFPGLEEQIRICRAKFAALQETRRQIDAALALPLDKRKPALADRWFDEVTAMTLQTENVWLEFIKHFREVDAVVSLQMRFKYDLCAIMENSGRERALIGRLIMQNADATPAEQAKLLRWQGAVDEAWSAADSLAEQGKLYPAITLAFKEAKSHYDNVYGMVQDIFYVPGARHGANYPFAADFWFELSEETTDSFYKLKSAVIKETHAYLDVLETRAQQVILWYTVLLTLTFMLCLYSFRVITYRVIHPINGMVTALLDALQGKPVFMPKVTNAEDEIGKLAQVLHAFQQNVEEIKRTSVMLQNYTYALERSNKELDDFAYIASHDLKEPLRGIHNHSRFLLEDNEGKLDDDSVQKLNRLVYLSQRMEKLVNDLLYFSRLGRQELAIQPTDINAVISDIESTLDVFLASHHARIVIPKLLPTITCDKTRVTEAFRNLITNGIKYNDKEEKIIEIGFLEVIFAEHGKTYRNVFYVKDNGKGIAREFHDEVFRIFKRLQGTADTPEEGTGVGLTFVKKIIERHGGKIWLESEPGQGTIFYFTLEEQDDDTAPVGIKSATADKECKLYPGELSAGIVK